MQAFACIADERGQALFDVEMNVFKIKRPDEFARFDFCRNLRHAAFDVSQIGGGDDVLARQHAGVRERTANILSP